MCCKKREVYLNTIQQFTMALSCVMTSSVIFLQLLRYDFFKLNFDVRLGQEVKVKLGSPFCKYFSTIDDLYNGAKMVNLPLAVVKI